MASSTSHKEYLVSLVSSFIGLTEDFSGNSGMGFLGIPPYQIKRVNKGGINVTTRSSYRRTEDNHLATSITLEPAGQWPRGHH